MSTYMNSLKIKSNLILFYEVSILAQSPLKPECRLYIHTKQKKLGYLQEVQQQFAHVVIRNVMWVGG